MPSREDLGTAHTEPPLDRVTPTPRQPDPAWTQKMPPGPDGRQRHLSAVWERVVESRGVQGTLRISFPFRIVAMGRSNLPEGQELVGLFAYRLVSGHWRVQTGVSRIGEEGTVTTAGVFGLNVVTGWDKRRPEWVDVAWLAMRVHVARQRKMGVADDIDVEGEDEPPTPSARKQAWHAQAKACAGQMSAVSTGLRMAMMASGQQADVDSVAPDAPRVSAALEEVRRQYPPPPPHVGGHGPLLC